MLGTSFREGAGRLRGDRMDGTMDGRERVVGLPPPQGLYDPQFEHDACGVGFVVNVSGDKSSSIIQKAIAVLINLGHRGACGCDPGTGDGAGILFQIPHRFFQRECSARHISLPDEGEYGVAMVFLPRADEDRWRCEAMFTEAVAQEGQVVLGWRDVPVDPTAIGLLARRSEPVIRQLFIGRGPGIADEHAFERKLYLIRRRGGKEGGGGGAAGGEDLSLPTPSLSSVTIVYKGLLKGTQLHGYYKDLSDPDLESALALVHSRFSTNTFPTWDLAHPYRFLAHNGEINALRGNRNWMRARTAALRSDLFGGELGELLPILTETGSDSMTIDNALEFLVMGGRSLPHAMMMLIPEAYTKDVRIKPDKRAFYEYHACVMEPWDGPAAILFTDGHRIGAVLDRNGLRPARYTITRSGIVVMASEVGVLPIRDEDVLYKGKMKPGKLFLVDTLEGRIIDDHEIKDLIIHKRPYRQWLDENRKHLDDLPPPPEVRH